MKPVKSIFLGLIALICADMLGAGRAQAQLAHVTIANPDKRLWRTPEERNLFQQDIIYRCFHVVCPTSTGVIISEAKGPAKRPTKAEMQTIATRDVPAGLARAGGSNGPPKISQITLQGWPAIRGTYDQGSGNKLVGIAFVQVHLDGAVVLIRAASGDLSFAPRALDAFLESITLPSP